MTARSFSQVDVFGRGPLSGNPVAVVHDASGLADDELQAFAQWTNLSETTFLLPSTTGEADYRVRIFTPAEELPFAGHPTLGSAHAWLEAGGRARHEDRVMQECGLGLVPLHVDDGLWFAAPDFARFGPPDEQTLARALRALGVERGAVLRASWIDNGPGWLGVQLDSARAVLALTPDFAAMQGLEIGVIGRVEEPERSSLGIDHEVRAFCPAFSVPEDPVTGSLNAGFARWLTREGQLPGDFVVRQGTVLGRDGRVRVRTDASGEIWVGGACRTVVSGTVDL